MKILNFGSLNIDYTYDVDHFVRGGETLSSKALHLFPGGKGLNQSIAASRSGADVWHAGAVGKSDGEFLIKQLNEAGVNTDYVKRLEVPSGHAIIQRQPDGGNCILLFGGSNQEITRRMADEVLEHFGKGDYLLLQNEISEVGYIMKRAAEKGMRIVLNPSPMDEKIGKLPLENVDYFLLNEVEAESLCGEGANRPEAMMEKTDEGLSEGEDRADSWLPGFPLLGWGKDDQAALLQGEGGRYHGGRRYLYRLFYRGAIPRNGRSESLGLGCQSSGCCGEQSRGGNLHSFKGRGGPVFGDMMNL